MTMARYELNFNLYNSEPQKYEELKSELEDLFGAVGEVDELDSTYEFNSGAANSVIVRNLILDRLENKQAITFRVKNLDGNDWADGETELGKIARLNKHMS